MEHERAHAESVQWEGEVRIERGMSLWSKRLGLLGKADVVEFRYDSVSGRIQARRQTTPHGPRGRIRTCSLSVNSRTTD
jgi:hypothetical protein